jgi:hypothetical protein
MRKAAAMFGGAAALALTVGLGGVAVDNMTSAIATATPSSVHGTPAATNAGADNNAHVLAAGCIVGLSPC